MNIELGATGTLVRGDVLDVNSKSLLRKLQQYDEQLYLKWVCRDVNGHVLDKGYWEVRRRPEKVPRGCPKHPDDHLVLKADYLSYSILDTLKKRDMWNWINYRGEGDKRLAQWIADQEHNEYLKKTEAEEKAYKEALYNMRQQGSALKKLREHILTGGDPNDLARFWK